METGKKVATVYFGNGDKVSAPEAGGTLEILNESHGTYDMDWVVQKNGEGVETSRHNMTYVESIIWETANVNPAKKIP